MNNKADIGVVGLAVMGENLILNMESKGFTVACFNRTTSKVDDFMNSRAKDKNIIGCHNIEELVKNLEKPRKIMLMVKAGGAVDEQRVARRRVAVGHALRTVPSEPVTVADDKVLEGFARADARTSMNSAPAGRTWTVKTGRPRPAERTHHHRHTTPPVGRNRYSPLDSRKVSLPDPISKQTERCFEGQRIVLETRRVQFQDPSLVVFFRQLFRNQRACLSPQPSCVGSHHLKRCPTPKNSSTCARPLPSARSLCRLNLPNKISDKSPQTKTKPLRDHSEKLNFIASSDYIVTACDISWQRTILHHATLQEKKSAQRNHV